MNVHQGAGTSGLTPEQTIVFDYVERNRRAISLLGESIFYFGELGMQE